MTTRFTGTLLLLAALGCADPKLMEATPRLDILQVLPASARITVGARASLGAQRVLGSEATNVTAQVSWLSDDPSVATVSYTAAAGAVVEAVGPGVAHVTATAGTISAMAEFIVIAGVASLETDKGSFVMAQGSTRALGAIMLATDGTKRALEDATWGTSDQGVASVDEDGVVTGVGVGSATLTLTRDGLTASQVVRVRAETLSGVQVAAQSGTTLPLGQTSAISVTGTFESGTTQELGALFDFASDAPDTLAVEAEAGALNALAGDAAGAATLTGTGKPGTLVAGQIVSLSFSVIDAAATGLALEVPATLSTNGEQAEPIVTATYPGELSFPIDAALSAEPEGIVYIDNASGTISALAAGTATIRATLTLKDADSDPENDPKLETTQSVTVVDDDISALAIEAPPAAPALTVDGTLSLAASAMFGALDVEDVTEPAIWSSEDEAIAVVSNVEGGRVTGLALGTATVRASYRGQSASILVSVTPAAASD